MATSVPLPLLLLLASAAEAAILVTLYPNHVPKASAYHLFAYLLAIQLISLALYRIFVYPTFLTPLRSIPGPKVGNLLLGHVLAEFEHPVGATFRKWVEEIPNNGLIHYRGILNENVLLVTGPKALQEILVNRAYEFEKPPKMSDALKVTLGTGILFREGDGHKFARKNLMPLFGFRQIKDLYPLFWQTSLRLMQGINQQIGEQGQSELKDTAIVDMSHWAAMVTLDLIGLGAIGHDFGTLRNRDDPLVRAYEELLDPTLEVKLLFAAQIFGPGHIVRKLPFPAMLRTKAIAKTLRDTCLRLVNAGKQVPSAVMAKRKDITAMCIRSGHFSEQEIVDELLTFLAAGHETTANALCWASYLLAQHPIIQQRLREETRSLIPTSARLLSETELSTALESAPLLNGVLNETLRLYPTIPTLSRSNPKPIDLLGYYIPAGTRFTHSVAIVNRSPEMWGDDADDFAPSRWIDTTASGEQRPNNSGGASSNYALLTFNHGPRSCIGQGFARAELRCLLAALVGSFEISLAHPGQQVEQEGLVTLKPKDGMPLQLKALRDW